MRLDKFLADCNTGTRSQVKKYIKQGLVRVNGQIVKDNDYKIDENNDSVSFKDQVLSFEKFAYYILNKPSGCVTARNDKLHKTVMDYMPSDLGRDFSPVGRLDLDTEGLLLITNDGELNHRLMSPAHHVPKTYYARLDAPVPESAPELFRKGMDIGDDSLCKPAELEILEDGLSARLTITEGRYHQVKRMFEKVGCTVTYLKRESLGSLVLNDLKTGQYRKLSKEEIEKL